MMIKAADKSRVVVVLNSDDSHAEVRRQCNDRKFYKPLNNNPTAHVMRFIKTIVDKANLVGHLDDSTAKFLINTFPSLYSLCTA